MTGSANSLREIRARAERAIASADGLWQVQGDVHELCEVARDVEALVAHALEMRRAILLVLPRLDFHRGQTLTKADELQIEWVSEVLCASCSEAEGALIKSASQGFSEGASE